MKTVLTYFVVAFIYLCSSAMALDTIGYQYLSPKPGAQHVSKEASIILRFADISPAALKNLSSFISVTDENGVRYDGQIKVASDNKSIIFDPAGSFASGSVVNVSLHPDVGAKADLHINFSFSVSDYEEIPIEPLSFDTDVLSKSVSTVSTGPWYTPQTLLKKSSGASNVAPNGVSVPSDFPPVVITVNDNPDSGYIFMNNWNGTPYNIIFDNTGSPVWYHRYPDRRRDFKVQKNGLITMLVRGGYPFGQGFIAMDNTYTVVDSFHAVNGYATDEHELQVLEDGHYLLVGIRETRVDMSQYVEGGSKNASVLESIIQEFTPEHDLILEWRSWDHMDIAATSVPGENDLQSNYIRFPHINAIDIDDDGNILISSRHASEITKIDRQTGDVIWRLGGEHNQFKFVNDLLNGPENQHDIRALGNGHYTVFDNGNEHIPSVSRAVEWKVDTDSMTAELVWEFRDTPDKYSHWMGNHQRLPNGNRLINSADGSLPKITEVRENGEIAFELWWRDYIHTYRVFRFPWQGVAKEPYLIVEPHKESVNLIFNKFGDADVAYYNIYADTSPDPTTLVDTSKSTFASFTELKNETNYYFRVTAVNHDGIESKFSNEERAFINFVEPGANMVLNGDFSDNKRNWIFWAGDGASATWAVEDGLCHLKISNGSDQDYKVQLVQLGLELLQGEQYIFEFDAWADEQRVIFTFLYGEPDQNYSQTSYVALKKQKQHYSFPFTMLAQSNFNAYVVFAFGGHNADVYLDNISVRRVVESDVTRDKAQIPLECDLQGNFPNPFNAQTTVRFYVPEQTRVKLEIYNILGQYEKTAVNEVFQSGVHNVKLDGNDLSSGVFFCKMTTESTGFVDVHKMIVMK